MSGVDVHMRETDAFSWTMETDPILRMPVVAVAVLDGVPDWTEVVTRLERLTRAVPMFRQRVVPTPGGLAPPKWVVDGGFDIGWHVRRIALPAGSDLEAVLAFAAKLGMASFDPMRPLWEVWLVEGLESGGAAWVAKVHHTLTDGVGGVQLLAHVFDVDGTPLATAPTPPLPPPPGDARARALVRSGLAHNGRQALAVVRGGAAGLARTLDAARHGPVAAGNGAIATWRSLLEALAPNPEKLSPVMTDRGLRRRYATIDVPLEALRAAGHLVGGTVNDAFVAAATGGMRRYHGLHDTSVPALRMVLPISTREPGDATGGNRMALIRIEMPLLPADPAGRMTEIRRRIQRWKGAPGLAYMEAGYGAVNYLPAGYLQGLAKHNDFVASNVPGFPVPVRLAGPRVLALYPFSPTGGAAVNLTMMSCARTAHVGVNIDPDAIPDVDAFMTCMRAGFDEVLTVTGPARGRRRSAAYSSPSPSGS